MTYRWTAWPQGFCIILITSLRATPDAGCPLNRSGPAAQRGWHEWLAGVAAAGQETIIRMRIRRFFCPARAASRDCGPTRTHAA